MYLKKLDRVTQSLPVINYEAINLKPSKLLQNLFLNLILTGFVRGVVVLFTIQIFFKSYFQGHLFDLLGDPFATIF